VRRGQGRGILLVMPGEPQIDYEVLGQDAMRGIVRTVLLHVAKLGALPGEHHFYIAFNTGAPGVVISGRLKEKYPEEMTIVLQHRFWDLRVSEGGFEVKLTFDGVPERLAVPFAAIRVFFDPSVPYGLQFDGSDLAGNAAGDFVPGEAESHEAEPAVDAAPARLAQAPSAGPEKKVRSPRKPRAGKRDDGAGREAAKPAPALAQSAEAGPPRQGARPRLVASKRDAPNPAANDTKVVQLDAFRKK
jgi:hypothetical protein